MERLPVLRYVRLTVFFYPFIPANRCATRLSEAAKRAKNSAMPGASGAAQGKAHLKQFKSQVRCIALFLGDAEVSLGDLK